MEVIFFSSQLMDVLLQDPGRESEIQSLNFKFDQWRLRIGRTRWTSAGDGMTKNLWRKTSMEKDSGQTMLLLDIIEIVTFFALGISMPLGDVL